MKQKDISASGMRLVLDRENSVKTLRYYDLYVGPKKTNLWICINANNDITLFDGKHYLHFHEVTHTHSVDFIDLARGR